MTQRAVPIMALVGKRERASIINNWHDVSLYLFIYLHVCLSGAVAHTVMLYVDPNFAQRSIFQSHRIRAHWIAPAHQKCTALT